MMATVLQYTEHSIYAKEAIAMLSHLKYPTQLNPARVISKAFQFKLFLVPLGTDMHF